MRLPHLILSCILTLLAGSAGAATYRWVDEQGKVHYGDAIPAQQSDLGHEVLDEQGRVRKEIPRTRLTPEERQRRQDAAARRAEQAQVEDEQRRRDRALLTSYTTAEEIDLARDRALELEDLNLRGLKTRLNAAADKLSYASGQIRSYESRREVPPRTFQQMQDEAQADLAHIGELIRQSQQATEDLKARYLADKIRFKELKGLR
jgi:hypothetical protein